MEPAFIPLGFIGDDESSHANAVSPDGTVVVGNSQGDEGTEAFRWTAHEGMIGLGDLEGGGFASRAFDVSDDGAVVVGEGRSERSTEPFRWTEAEGMVSLGDLPGGDFGSNGARGVSADGSVVVGDSISGSGFEAFRWTAEEGMIGLGDLPGGGFMSRATGVSPDGRIIVGSSSSGGTEAFAWCAEDGMVGLGFMEDATSSEALAISADGWTVVGHSSGAFRMHGLGVMERIGRRSYSARLANAVSRDGSVVVGTARTREGDRAFIWDRHRGFRLLRDFLADEYGLDTPILVEASGISSGGLHIVGVSTRREAFLITLRDCNGNGVPDYLDVADGTSADCNGDGAPDECGVLYVDASATGKECGASWTDAYVELQDALDAAERSGGNDVEIWVAEGTYTPDRDTGDREATFRLLSGVAIYGGFKGSEGERRQRDPQRNPTVLSGDLDGNDGPDFTNREDNVYHVVTADDTDATAILDGVVIRGGHATFGGGGGIHNENGSPVIRNCTLRDNFARTGGAMHNDFGAAPTIVNCRFLDNAARNEGGALYNFAAEPTIESSEFTGNSAMSDGGAMFNDLSIFTLAGSTVSANTSDSRGGGIYNYVGVEARITSTILWANTDGQGGGESAQIFSNPSNIVVIDYSIVEGWTGDFGGEGNSGDDPRFVDAGTGNLRLSADSPAINTGDPSVTLERDVRDLDGHARVLCGRTDIGAYEFGIGDHNCDRSVTLDDFRAWGDCMTGPDAGPYDDGCEAFDFEFDGDADVRDFAAWQLTHE